VAELRGCPGNQKWFRGSPFLSVSSRDAALAEVCSDGGSQVADLDAQIRQGQQRCRIQESREPVVVEVESGQAREGVRQLAEAPVGLQGQGRLGDLGKRGAG
jgi:hypothetical protein